MNHTDSWLGGISGYVEANGTSLAIRAGASLLVIILSWAIVQFGARSFERSAKRIAVARNFDDYQTQTAISDTKPMTMALRIIVAIVALIALLGIWGLTGAFTGLLAGAGFAGIVIGLAAGDIISDILAGFMLLYRGPFHVGDWVEISGKQGIVKDVGLADTTIKTFDNEIISMPNAMVETGMVINYTMGRKLRLKIPVTVEYGTDLAKAKEILLGAANEQPHLLPEPVPSAWVRNFLDSGIELDVRVWIDPVTTSALQVRSNLIEQIHQRFRAAGIVIAFPHMQVVQGRPWQVTKDLE